MGKIFKRPTIPAEEVLEKSATCNECGKSLKKGSIAIICRFKNGKRRATFCSQQCQMDMEEKAISAREHGEPWGKFG